MGRILRQSQWHWLAVALIGGLYLWASIRQQLPPDRSAEIVNTRHDHASGLLVRPSLNGDTTRMSQVGEYSAANGEAGLRLLVVSLEYRAGTFSGNGIYSRSIVRSLVKIGHRVLVISAAPPSDSPASDPPVRITEHRSSSDPASASPSVEAIREEAVVEVQVPVWGRLDWKSGWQHFAAVLAPPASSSAASAGAAAALPSAALQAGGSEAWGPLVARRVAQFAPQWALLVDWSAVPAFEALLASLARLQGTSSSSTSGVSSSSSSGGGSGGSAGSVSHSFSAVAAAAPRLPVAYLNFRVYSLSSFQEGAEGREERRFYEEREGAAVAEADVIAALSTRDALFLASGLPLAPRAGVVPAALLPPLREDMRLRALELAAPTLASWAARRRFLTCCVRLSPEKNPLLFVRLVRQLAPALRRLGLQPLLCAGGAAAGNEYAEGVKAALLEAAPEAVLVEGFMGPERMAEIFSQTVLNVHPCIYDAYGMTMVEAAAFGAPSLVHVGEGGAVGATELLDPQKGFVVPMDLNGPVADIAARLESLLQKKDELAQTALAARNCSLSWSEEANARRLVSMLH